MIDMKRVATMAAVVVSAVLAACGGKGSDDDDGTARIRLLNASGAYASLDFYVDDVKKNSGLGYGAVGEYASVSTSASLSTVITNTGSTSALSTTGRSLSKDVAYTVVAYGWQGAMKTALLEENVTAADSGKTKLMVLNSAIDAGSVDVYLTGTDEALDNASAVAASVAGGATVGYTSVTSGTYRLRVTAAGDKSDLRLDVSGLTLASTQVATLIVTPGSGGVLVHALLAVQQGSVSAFNNNLARARVVASVAGNGKVTASLGGSTLLSGGTSPTIGSYGTFVANNSALQLVVNGTPVAVTAPALAAGSDTTLLVWGSAAAPQLAVINDDNRLPTLSTNAKLRLVHAVSGLSDALTLTADFSVIAGDVLPGTASAFGNVTGGSSLRLDVSSPLSTAALYTLSDGTLASRGVYTLFMLGEAAQPSAALRKER
ncbi:DUF4397 domain-containing protein [Aquabacterium sp.]|uniref:DUF4397 domain-containing protein n=1 Tax=Aquabacterium sp. TaxID=1872578 RepID=UPI002BA39773|nr:DUF4397 domain-containing protein [Aquabacterium sp.]HSW08832.1 DUF4397 domain-containing protein [Aquabacterium sp.]